MVAVEIDVGMIVVRSMWRLWNQTSPRRPGHPRDGCVEIQRCYGGGGLQRERAIGRARSDREGRDREGMHQPCTATTTTTTTTTLTATATVHPPPLTPPPPPPPPPPASHLSAPITNCSPPPPHHTSSPAHNLPRTLLPGHAAFTANGSQPTNARWLVSIAI